MTPTLLQLKPTGGGAATFSYPPRPVPDLVTLGQAQLALPLQDKQTNWEYAAIGGLKFKYTAHEGKFLVGHSRVATRPFEEVVLGFYDFAGKWFEPSSLAFIPQALPWTLYGWSEGPTYLAAAESASSPYENLTASVWVGWTGVGTTGPAIVEVGVLGVDSVIASPRTAFQVGIAGHPRKSLLAEVDRVIESASEDNWDAYGGTAITAEAMIGAMKFINLLNRDIPDPEVTPGAGGEITFDWYRTQRLIFSVSIAHEGRLHYAGMFGMNKIAGTEEIGTVLPDSVRMGIMRVLGKGL